MAVREREREKERERNEPIGYNNIVMIFAPKYEFHLSSSHLYQ
jgi:hypothetical protein